jgi:hypothetical protein
LKQLAQALAAAHAQRVIHRDLKPDNVMVRRSEDGLPSVVVLDFGIAKLLDDDDGPKLTHTGTVFGTPEFMSPEQAQGLSVTFSSDIYSLGALAFFMLTGRAPFESADRTEIIQRQIAEPPPLDMLLRDTTMPHELVVLVQDCLRKEVEDRPETMEVLLSRLENINHGPKSPQSDLNLKPPTKPTKPLRPLGKKDTPVTDISFDGDLAPMKDETFTWGGDPDDRETDNLLAAPLDGSIGVAPDSALGGSRIPTSWIVIAIVLAGGAVAGYFLASGGTDEDVEIPENGDVALQNGATIGEEVPVIEPAPPIPLPERAFHLIDAAQQTGLAAVLLRSAEVEDAATTWASARELLGNEEANTDLPVAQNIEEAQSLIAQADTALNERQCRRADRAVVAMRDLSPALRRRYLAPLEQCNRRREERGRPPRTLGD